ncbi:MAG: DUF1501 domain-containing protein [Planctomycetaceae bacterium]|nr:DUF1501 domain-containing protein [Planctomycetaceae bacterium]
MLPQRMLQLQTARDGTIDRRAWLRTMPAIAAVGVGLDRYALTASAVDAARRQGKACIFLYMRGAPSQFETFDPKPGTSNGGPTQSIATAVTDIRIAEGWDHVAREMNDIALIRSMTNGNEGNHDRAVYQLHTGYLQSGTVRHPTLGSVAAAELGDEAFDLPHFVAIGHRAGIVGPGYLGMSYAPFAVTDPRKLPNHIEPTVGIDARRFTRRNEMLNGLESDFAETGGAADVRDHQLLYHKAQRLVLSPRLKAFDLSHESDQTRDRYGRSEFGQGCLLARRLIEQGVTCVEVESPGWDTHDDNFKRVKTLASDVDPAFAALVADLKDRGLLDSTLVVWLGEFGRTPRINGKTGRDHHPQSFNVAIAGAGIRGGRVIGATDADGNGVDQRPVTVPDLFCTFCQALGVDPRKERISALGRPLKIVEGGEPVTELF